MDVRIISKSVHDLGVRLHGSAILGTIVLTAASVVLSPSSSPLSLVAGISSFFLGGWLKQGLDKDRQNLVKLSSTFPLSLPRPLGLADANLHPFNEVAASYNLLVRGHIVYGVFAPIISLGFLLKAAGIGSATLGESVSNGGLIGLLFGALYALYIHILTRADAKRLENDFSSNNITGLGRRRATVVENEKDLAM